MKIGLLRHFAVKKNFLKGSVKQSEVLKWFTEYDASTDLEEFPVELKGDWEICYCSMLPRAITTAKAIYGDKLSPVAGFNEPSVDGMFKRDLKLPFLLWAMLIRFAILSNHKSQSDRKEVLQQRIETALKPILEGTHQHVLIVSHAFVMSILSKILLKKGFSGKKLGRPEHAVLYVFEKS